MTLELKTRKFANFPNKTILLFYQEGMTSMPKGYVDGQVICGFLAQFYTHVVIAQH
jgi:hypothetical protein